MAADISGVEWVAIIGAIGAAVQVIGTVITTVLQSRTKTAVDDGIEQAARVAAEVEKKADRVSQVLHDATAVSEEKLHEIARVGEETLKASVDTLDLAARTERVVNGEGNALRKLAYDAGVRDERARQSVALLAPESPPARSP